MRHLALVLLAALLAAGLASQVDVRDASGAERALVRGPDQVLGAPRYGQAAVERYARSMNSTRYIMQTIPIYYDLAPRRNIAPDVLVAQAMLETGYGRYGGDSRPWNMAGIKKGGIRGDDPRGSLANTEPRRFMLLAPTCAA